MMPARWQVLRCAPDEAAKPAELVERWAGATDIEIPCPVGVFADGVDPDAFDWWHRCVLQTAEPLRIEFDGLTFPADVFVDGDLVTTVESMFLPVHVDLGEGTHEICVRFRSLQSWLRSRRPRGRWRSSLVGAPGLRWARTTLLGRAPVYGNVPAPVGFWRPAHARAVAAAHHVTVRTDPDTGLVVVTGGSGAPDGTPVALSVSGPSGKLLAQATDTIADGHFSVEVLLSDVQLWWPHGYGAQPLYHAEIDIAGQRTRRLVGFRSVQARTGAGGFGLRVNGVDIFCRGATWSPPDAVRLHTDRATMHAQVAAFADSGATMLRIVGGLLPEQPEFWDSCAELGVLVWQDAMQATFDPPEDLGPLIVREVTELLAAVSGNPALAVVSGGSETLQRPEMLGLDSGEFSMPVIDELLPEAVSRGAAVPYVRASPAPPAGSTDLAIRPDTGVAHWFGVGGYLRPVADVRSAGVRFAAECLAFANPPSPQAVERYFGSAAAAGHEPAWKAEVPRDRGASWDFEDVRDFYVREVFGQDPLAVRRIDPPRYLEMGRLAIAEAMLQCFGYWRRPDSGCAGALVLTGKDTRPGAGWGLLDVDGAPKAAMVVLRRVWAPVAVIVSDAGLSGIRVDIHNDTPDPVHGELILRATDTSGRTIVDVTREITVAARHCSTWHDAELSGAFRDLSHAFRFSSPATGAVEAVLRLPGRDLPLRDALIVKPQAAPVNSALQAVATARPDGDWDVEISAASALRYVRVETTGREPSDNFFALPAGLPYRIRLTGGPAAATLGSVSSVDAHDVAPIEVRS